METVWRSLRWWAWRWTPLFKKINWSLNVEQFEYESVRIIICVCITIFISSYISLWSLTTSWTRTLSGTVEGHQYSNDVLWILSLQLPRSLTLTPLLICFQILTPRTGNHFRQPNQNNLHTAYQRGLTIAFYPYIFMRSWPDGCPHWPCQAQNTPLWSELTAIGWLFISVDPVANSYRFSPSSCRCGVIQGPKPKVV